MAREVKLLDVFLSSPSDVDHERARVVQAATEWNSLRSRSSGYFLNILTWEDVVSPKLSDRPQSVINEQIGDEYDVYLGLMWGRFGSSTGVAASGTVEEFERALNRYRQGNAIRLAMLFKTTAIPQDQLDGMQFERIKAFKKQFAGEGGLYAEFDSDERLRRILNGLFEDLISSRAHKSRSEDHNHLSDEAITLEVEVTDEESDLEDDLGLFEVNERLNQVAAEQSRFFERLTETSHHLNEAMRVATDDLDTIAKLGNANAASLKPAVSDITRAMDLASDYLSQNLPLFIQKNDELVDMTDKSLDISRDFGIDESNTDELKLAVRTVIDMLESNQMAISGAITSMSSLPRLSSDFNKSKKRLGRLQLELTQEIARLHGLLSSSLALY